MQAIRMHSCTQTDMKRKRFRQCQHSVLTDGVGDAVQRERRRAFSFAELVRPAQRAAGTCWMTCDGRGPDDGGGRLPRCAGGPVDRRRRTVTSSVIVRARPCLFVVAGSCRRSTVVGRCDAAGGHVAALFRSPRHGCN